MERNKAYLEKNFKEIEEHSKGCLIVNCMVREVMSNSNRIGVTDFNIPRACVLTIVIS